MAEARTVGAVASRRAESAYALWDEGGGVEPAGQGPGGSVRGAQLVWAVASDTGIGAELELTTVKGLAGLPDVNGVELPAFRRKWL